MKSKVIKIKDNIHKLIKHRSKYLHQSMTEYITKLVLDEIDLAEIYTDYDPNKK